MKEIVIRTVQARSVKGTVVQAFFYHLFDCLELNYRICVCEQGILGRKKTLCYLMRSDQLGSFEQTGSDLAPDKSPVQFTGDR